MRARNSFVALCLIGALVACDDEVGPTEVETFTAELSGANVNPVRTTPATGTATLSVVGGTILYRIDVTNITNVTAAHIHAPAVAPNNAGVVVNLCGTGAPAPPCMSGTGVLAAGVATQVGGGMPFDRLLVLLRTDSAYVNVHTNDLVDPPNTGPGDFPGGEIRGQITKQ